MTDCRHSPVTGIEPRVTGVAVPCRGMLLLTSYTICATYNQQQLVRRRAHLHSASAVAIDAEILLLILCRSSKNGGGRTADGKGGRLQIPCRCRWRAITAAQKQRGGWLQIRCKSSRQAQLQSAGNG